MKRREFISVLGGAAAVWPLGAQAQQATLPVIGFINGASPGAYAPNIDGFLKGLKESGYVEGQNVRIEYRWAEGRYDQLPDMAAELVRRRVAVIVANTPAAPIAKASTATIPIVFMTGEDPVANGLVTSLNRPSGNITGVGITGPILLGKQLGVLHQFLPVRTSIVFLVNPNNPNSEPSLRGAREAALSLGRQIQILNASSEVEIDKAFTMLAGVRRTCCCSRRLFHCKAGATRGPGNTRGSTRDVSISRIHRNWRSDELRGEFVRPISTGRSLRRENSRGSQAKRSAGSPTNEICVVHQSRDDAETRPPIAVIIARSRR